MTNLEILKGKPLILETGVVFNHPKLGDLIEFSANEVYGFMNLFCLKPQDLSVELWKNNIDFQELTDYQLFMMLYMSKPEFYNKLFNQFTSMKSPSYAESEGDAFLVDFNEDGKIASYLDFKAYSEASKFYKRITCFKNKDIPKFSSQGTKKRLMDMEVESMDDEIDNKESDELVDLVGALVWGNTSGYNFDNVWDLYFYQFNTGVQHIDKIKYTSALLSGVYSGNVDTKKIDKKELDWKHIK